MPCASREVGDLLHEAVEVRGFVVDLDGNAIRVGNDGQLIGLTGKRVDVV